MHVSNEEKLGSNWWLQLNMSEALKGKYYLKLNDFPIQKYIKYYAESSKRAT